MTQGISVPVLTNYHYHDVERKMATMLLDCAKMEREKASDSILDGDTQKFHRYMDIADIAMDAAKELNVRIERRDNAHLDKIIDEASDQLNIPRVYRGVLVE